MLLRFMFLLVAAAGAFSAAAAPLQVRGSATATAPFIAAQTALAAAGLPITVDSDSNTSAAIAAVGEKVADLAVATRPLTAAERAAYPERRMEERPLAQQMLTLVVSNDVWASGLRALSREQVRHIYEKEITNWKELGGPDHAINFFNPEQGHGVWELMVTWLYGDVRLAPLEETFPVVKNSEETLEEVEFHAGSLAVISPLRPDGRGTFALAIKGEDGTVLPANVHTANYPLGRRLSVVTAQQPTGDLRRLIEFFQGRAGAEFLKKCDFLPLESEH